MNGSQGIHLDVLGTVFSIFWGEGVDPVDRRAFEKAWELCLIAPPPKAGNAVATTEEYLPMTARLSYKTSRPDAGSGVLRSSTFAGLAESLTSEITLAAILEQAGELTMLHACGIADPNTGAVIALVARSGTGKTTAAISLAKTFSYVTDETVAIRADGTVIAYQKPLSIKQHGGRPKLQIGPNELGLAPAPDRLRIAAIILLDRVQAGAPVPPQLERVPLTDAVLALIPETSSQSSLAHPLQSLCRLIDTVDGILKVTYAEAEDLAPVLEPLFRQRANAAQKRSRPTWSAWGPVEGEPYVPTGFLQRASVLDAVTIAGEMVVLLNSEVIRLAGIAPFIWQITCQPISQAELIRCVGAHHGMPGGYELAVAQAIEELVAKGILVRGTP